MADSILGRPDRSFAEVAGSLLGKRKKEAKKQALEAIGWEFLFKGIDVANLNLREEFDEKKEDIAEWFQNQAGIASDYYQSDIVPIMSQIRSYLDANLGGIGKLAVDDKGKFITDKHGYLQFAKDEAGNDIKGQGNYFWNPTNPNHPNAMNAWLRSPEYTKLVNAGGGKDGIQNLRKKDREAILTSVQDTADSYEKILLAKMHDINYQPDDLNNPASAGFGNRTRTGFTQKFLKDRYEARLAQLEEDPTNSRLVRKLWNNMFGTQEANKLRLQEVVNTTDKDYAGFVQRLKGMENYKAKLDFKDYSDRIKPTVSPDWKTNMERATALARDIEAGTAIGLSGTTVSLHKLSELVNTRPEVLVVEGEDGIYKEPSVANSKDLFSSQAESSGVLWWKAPGAADMWGPQGSVKVLYRTYHDDNTVTLESLTGIPTLRQEEINNRSASMALANMILSVADDNLAKGIKAIEDGFSGNQIELNQAVRRFTEDNAEKFYKQALMHHARIGNIVLGEDGNAIIIKTNPSSYPAIINGNVDVNKVSHVDLLNANSYQANAANGINVSTFVDRYINTEEERLLDLVGPDSPLSDTEKEVAVVNLESLQASKRLPNGDIPSAKDRGALGIKAMIEGNAPFSVLRGTSINFKSSADAAPINYVLGNISPDELWGLYNQYAATYGRNEELEGLLVGPEEDLRDMSRQGLLRQGREYAGAQQREFILEDVPEIYGGVMQRDRERQARTTLGHYTRGTVNYRDERIKEALETLNLPTDSTIPEIITYLETER